MGDSTRILHVVGRMERGGAQMRTLDVIRRMDREQTRFEFCALSGRPGGLESEIQKLGGEVHLLRLGVGFPAQFRRLLRCRRFDVVHSHVHYASGFILRLAACEHVAVRIAHFRNTSDGRGHGLRQRLQRRLMRRWIDRYATHILAVSQGAMAASWPRWAEDPRCRVIYNGLDVSAFTQPADCRGVRREFDLPGECRLYIHIGRMDPQKNHPRVISVFAEILMRCPDSYLLLVGQGGNEIERRLVERVTEMGIASHVVLAGVRSDVPRLLKAADVLIFPSLWEGLPGVVLEACAAGTPVIASDLPGVKEIAGQFPHVRCLSLSAPDSEWASAAEMACGDRRKGAESEDLRWFASSVFGIDECVKSLRTIWDGRPSLVGRT